MQFEKKKSAITWLIILKLKLSLNALYVITTMICPKYANYVLFWSMVQKSKFVKSFKGLYLLRIMQCILNNLRSLCKFSKPISRQNISVRLSPNFATFARDHSSWSRPEPLIIAHGNDNSTRWVSSEQHRQRPKARRQRWIINHGAAYLEIYRCKPLLACGKYGNRPPFLWSSPPMTMTSSFERTKAINSVPVDGQGKPTPKSSIGAHPTAS